MKPTQEQALAWAREAKFEVDENHDVWITDGYWLKELERFATLAYEAGRKGEREWQGLTAKDLAEIPPSCYEGAIWADAKLKEKNT